MSRLKWVCLGVAGALTAVVALVVAVAAVQASQRPPGKPQYVPLGSSFAAGTGLGRLKPDAPFACARSVGGYPTLLAARRGLSLVDMSCGGAVTRQLWLGGQVFQGAQIAAITAKTQLVTLTIGGNDIGYVGDLSLLAARGDRDLFGGLVRTFWKGAEPSGRRDYAELRRDLDHTLAAVRRRAPEAKIVVATYPTPLPAEGTCDRIGMTAEYAALMRKVGDDLAAVTRQAAQAAGATVVDMHALSRGHDACSPQPWVSGWKGAGVSPFHPTAAGTEATAAAISAALDADVSPPPR